MKLCKRDQIIAVAAIVVAIVTLVILLVPHQHSAAWQVGYNVGQNTTGGGLSQSQCVQAANQTPATPGFGPQQLLDEANGFMAGCEAG